MRVMKLQSRFIASIASEVLVEGQFVVTFDVKIFVGTKDEWIPCGVEVSLNRTIGGNDDATGTITDMGGNLSIPIPVTVTAGTAMDTLPTSNSAMSLRSWLTTIRNNVAWLVSNKANLASPALTGTPTAPTAAATVNNTRIATTEFVRAAVGGHCRRRSYAYSLMGLCGTGQTKKRMGGDLLKCSCNGANNTWWWRYYSNRTSRIQTCW